jgi:hypothetical protein
MSSKKDTDEPYITIGEIGKLAEHYAARMRRRAATNRPFGTLWNCVRAGPYEQLADVLYRSHEVEDYVIRVLKKSKSEAAALSWRFTAEDMKKLENVIGLRAMYISRGSRVRKTPDMTVARAEIEIWAGAWFACHDIRLRMKQNGFKTMLAKVRADDKAEKRV